MNYTDQKGHVYTEAVAATGRVRLAASGQSWAMVQWGNVTGLTFKYEGCANKNATTEVFTKLPSWDQAGTKTAANSSVTPSDNDSNWIPVGGFDELVINVSAVVADSPFTVGFTDDCPFADFTATVTTEFPAASAASDNYTNPTTTDVKAFGMLWDGATWDRSPGTSALGALVQPAHGKTLKAYTTGATAVTADTDVIAAVSSKRLKVYALSIFTDSTTQNVPVFKSNGTGGTALYTAPLQALSGTLFGHCIAVEPPGYLFATVAGEKLTLDVSAAQNVWLNLMYWDDDAS